MKYIIKTNHLIYKTTTSIAFALGYAMEMTRDGKYPSPLKIETEGRDEICIVVNGCCYQVSDPGQIIKNERSEDETA